MLPRVNSAIGAIRTRNKFQKGVDTLSAFRIASKLIVSGSLQKETTPLKP